MSGPVKLPPAFRRDSLLRLTAGGTEVDPNNVGSVEQVGSNIVFTIDSGAGPHTGPHQGTVVAWKAKDVLGSEISAPWWDSRVDLHIISRPDFDSGIVIEAGICTGISPVSEYFATGVYFVSGGVCHRWDIAPGPTQATATIGLKFITRTSFQALTAGQNVNREKTLIRNAMGSFQTANGASYTSTLYGSNFSVVGTELYYYVAVYSRAGALASEQKVALQVYQGPNSTFDRYVGEGERFWQIGDSITQEVESYTDQAESNRNLLIEDLSLRGPIQPVGHTFETSYPTWQRHSGVGGLTAALAVTNYPTYRNGAGSADIVTVMLGTNDAAAAVSASAYGTSMQALVDLILETDPNARIYVAYPTPTTNGSNDTLQQAYELEIDALVGVEGVADMRTGFDTGTMLADTTHPNVLGHAHIASVWASTIQLAGEL